MFHLVAPLCIHPNPAVKVAFSLWIEPPDPDADPTETIAAFISPELETSRIARELARSFGATREGERIAVTIRQYHHKTLRVLRFGPISIQVGYAHARLGQDYIHLGIEDLDHYFDLTLWQPEDERLEDPFMLLEPRKGFERLCQVL